MKRLIILLLGIFVFYPLFAQVKTATKEDIDRFLKSKTYIVLEDDPFSAFNAFVEEQISTVWKLTPYEIISIAEFEAKCGDPSSSFLLVAEARFDETKSSLFRSNTDLFDNMDSYNYTILNLVMGDKTKNINNMPDLATVPVCYSTVEDEETYEYKMGVLIYFMQFYVKYCSNNPGKDIRDLEKENSGKIANYELWLVKEEIATEINTPDKIKSVYPYTVKFVTREEIEKAITERNPKVAILHKVGPEGSVQGDSKCWKFIVTVADGNPLYFNSHKISASKPDAFLEEDFKKLGN